jgi:MFS family permease
VAVVDLPFHADRVQTYRELFAATEFRALWTSTALTTAAATMTSLALAVLVHERTGSALLAATAMFGPSLVQVLGASTLMSAADASPPRRTLTLITMIVAVAAMAQALLPLSPLGRLLVVFVAAYAGSIGAGVRWGLLSQVLPEGAYPLARSTMNLAVGAFQVVGFASSGLLLAVIDVRGVFLVSAALAVGAVAVVWRGVAERSPRRQRRAGLQETWRGNKALLSEPSTRPLLLALTVPSGLIVGCEALFVPYAGNAAGLLLAAVAAGMMTGDLLVGRFLTRRGRQRAGLTLRFVLAVPFLAFVSQPAVPLAAALAALAATGYAASLTQQEQLLALTPQHLHGQALGAEGAVMMTLQGLCAILAGALAEILPVGTAITLLATGSLIVSLALTPALHRTTRLANAASRTPSR